MTHYGHTNIAGPKVSSWKEGFRNFDSVEQMNKTIVATINKYVKPEDTLFFVGDWSFGGIKNIFLFQQLLNCKNIHFIYGNHDHAIETNKSILVDNFGPAVMPHDLFVSVQHKLELVIDGQLFILDHFPHAQWNESHHGSINLYGHCHSSFEPHKKGKQMDIGIDNAFKLTGEYRPFSLQEVLDIMAKIEIHKIDHHNNKTNFSKKY